MSYIYSSIRSGLKYKITQELNIKLNLEIQFFINFIGLYITENKLTVQKLKPPAASTIISQATLNLFFNECLQSKMLYLGSKASKSYFYSPIFRINHNGICQFNGGFIDLIQLNKNITLRNYALASLGLDQNLILQVIITNSMLIIVVSIKVMFKIFPQYKLNKN